MANQKRKIEFIDLTGSDDENAYGSHSRKHQKQLPTPAPSSSQPASSGSIAVEVGHGRIGDSSYGEGVADIEILDEDVPEAFQLYGVLNAKVVGIQYYKGHATLGEIVLIRREPRNPYDSNAIQVCNVMGEQIGHLPRGVAAKLAPLIDDCSIQVEGCLTDNKRVYDVPIALDLFGTSNKAAQPELKQRMIDARLPISELAKADREEQRKKIEQEAARKRQESAARRKQLQQAAKSAGGVRKGGSGIQFDDGPSRGFANLTVPHGEDDGPSIEDLIDSSTSFNPREIGALVDKYGSGEGLLADLPMSDQPSALKTKLLNYQRQGLFWMLDRESPILPATGSTDSIQLWKRGSHGMFTNLATSFTSQYPTLASGGILADDMGLGKTIQVISLIVADPHREKRPTLIVAPLSVMSNWSGQVEAHLKAEHVLKVLVYHGNNKKNQRLEDYDVVVTTYQTMAQEYMPSGVRNYEAPIPRPEGLYSINWRRVVLDEGHQIRNPKAKIATAACKIMATSRWVLTGTPIVNNLRDLYSHVKFIGLTGGLEQQEIFTTVLIRPLNAGNTNASILLQALISTLCLRRMKDMKFINLSLPKLSSHKCSIAFLPKEREKYDALAKEAKGLLLQYQTHGNAKGENTYSHLLEVLLRLRQTCNHWKLCGDRLTKLMAVLEKHETVELTPTNLKALQDLLQISIDSQEDCPVCLETLHNPVITSCAHMFGSECIERVIETQHKCPMCRAELKDKTCLVQPAAGLGEADEGLDINTTSSKLEALLNILRASEKKKGTKTIVFSQWTSFLDIIQSKLDEEGFRYCRLDGKMNAASRDEALASLEKNPDCTIMLASLTVCSVGLNLVAANQVILADSWWAPAIEDQAVDRVHRLGQTRPTTVFRLVMEDSIEDRVLDIQQEKRKLMMLAFQEKTMKRGKETSARLADIQRLLK